MLVKIDENKKNPGDRDKETLTRQKIKEFKDLIERILRGEISLDKARGEIEKE